MRKIIMGLSAMAMLWATSCNDDLNVEYQAGEAAPVAFSISAPEINTRAYSDGTTATELQYAVYNDDGELLNDLTVTNGEIHGSTTVELMLTTGNTYSVVFWAAAEGAPYSLDFAAKKMTVDYSKALSNDEKRDAFYKWHTFTVSGAQTETIELRRPFAQLNVGTNDFAASTSAGYTPAKSGVKVRNVYKTLNFADGKVADPVEVMMDYAALPQGETFPVAGYDYLSMNYLLVPEAKGVIDIEFGYTDSDAAAAKTRIVGSVPVQRNYRTNVYGQLLTSKVGFNVIINPEFEDPDYNQTAFYTIGGSEANVGLLEEIFAEINNSNIENAYISIAGDQAVTWPAITLGTLKNVTIDGNHNAVMTIKTDANTNIENVTLKNIAFVYDGTDVNSSIVVNAEAQIENLLIEGCTFTGTGAKAGRGIYGQNPNATIVVRNSTFKNLGYPIYTMAAGGYESLTIEGCTFEDIKSWAIMPQYNSYLGDLTVSGNMFVNCVGGLVKAGAFTAGHTFTFTNNFIANSAEHPAKNWFSIDTTNASKVVKDNTKDGAAWTPGEAEGLK
ncbi:MAG: right-handed parallel beta-helix repeat-containing protein [Muribaculaceae bacterium]|nr:right-handed parallel beta-helix repeat-containing protein [Muribaculaceae bacterium]